MNIETRNRFISEFKQLTLENLKKQLASGKTDFQDDVYELLEQEAISRGISIESAKEEGSKSIIKAQNDNINRMIVFGYIFVFAAFGVPGLIIGAKLRSISKAQGINSKKAKTNGIVLSIIGGILFSLLCIGMIIFFIRIIFKI